MRSLFYRWCLRTSLAGLITVVSGALGSPFQLLDGGARPLFAQEAAPAQEVQDENAAQAPVVRGKSSIPEGVPDIESLMTKEGINARFPDATSTDPEALLAYTDMLRELQVPPTENRGALRVFLQHIHELRLKTALQGLSQKASGETEVRLNTAVGESYILLTRLGKDSKAELAKHIADLRGRTEPDLHMLAMELRVVSADAKDPKDTEALVAELEESAKKVPVDERFVRFWMVNALQVLDSMSDSEAASKLALRLAELAKQALRPEDAKLAKMFEGAARRMSLVGKTMEIQGATIDGKEFDLKQWKGKVVVVDFWATWCQPCLEELPNLMKYYEAYHHRGLEVIGVNLDDKRATLDRFLAVNQLPWPQMHHESKGPDDQHPLAEYYGIVGIPAVILIDQEGKVRSLEAYGDNLGRLLEETLGKADEPPLPADAPPTKEADATK